MVKQGLGHNSGCISISIKAKLFNSLNRYKGPEGPVFGLQLPAGATVGDVISRLGLPVDEIFLILKNGRDISSGLVGGPLNVHAPLEDGDVIAFSGPVPYSFGYGAPVV